MPYVYGAIMEMAVVFSVPLSLNHIGRRWTLISALFIATICSFLFAGSDNFLQGWSDLKPTKTTLAIISRVMAAASYYACLQFASEIFPTEIRGKGSSAFEITGGLGLFIQPQINYLVMNFFFLFFKKSFDFFFLQGQKH